VGTHIVRIPSFIKSKNRSQNDARSSVESFFNGADFVTRFNESSEAFSSFLVGLDMLGRDVAAKVYRTRTGLFRWHPMSHPDPRELPEASPAYREALVVVGWGTERGAVHRTPWILPCAEAGPRSHHLCRDTRQAQAAVASHAT